MGYVLDASVTLAWCFADEATENITALLNKLELEKALVPAIWPLEVGNILLAAARRKRITYADIAQFLEMLNSINIEIDIETIHKSFHETLSLAHSEGLTTYDAAYLELAMRTGLPLATKDKQLQDAGLRLGVQLLPV